MNNEKNLNRHSLRLSPKHGANPSLLICFWCEEPQGVALLGKINEEDSEAPPQCIASYEPCDSCNKKFDEGVTFFECRRTTVYEGQQSLQLENALVYPTGRYAVINADALDEEKGDFVFLDEEAFREMMNAIEKKEDDNGNKI